MVGRGGLGPHNPLYNNAIPYDEPVVNTRGDSVYPFLLTAGMF